MEKIASIFDYMKKAFRLNVDNKGLYKPIVLLILLKVTFFIIFGVMLYNFTLSLEDTTFNWQFFANFSISTVGGVFLMMVVVGIGSLIVEAGLYNMYRFVLEEGPLQQGVFSDGIRKYFWKFLFVNILTLIFWLLILIPYIIVGFVTLFIGFVLIPLIVSVFTIMWKIIIVVDGLSIMDALKKSIGFAKQNFVPLTALIIIKQAFSGFGSGGGSTGGNTSRFISDSGNEFIPVEGVENINPDVTFREFFTQALPYIKTAFYIMIPVITIAIVITSLIKMVFEVFFNMTLFVMYMEPKSPEKIEFDKEVL